MQHKPITLLGMSGVGKTQLSLILRANNWFHYCVDYRIGSSYLRHDIVMEIKRIAMSQAELRDLLETDSIDIEPNLSVDHLKPISNYLGKLGNPMLGGLALPEFRRRQQKFNQAEIRALYDLPQFIEYASQVYNCPGLVNDAGGSLCDLYERIDAPEYQDFLDFISTHSHIIYLQTDQHDELTLTQRAHQDPKPLYYREGFFNYHLAEYLQTQQLEYAAQIDPEHFLRWIFPRLYRERKPRYETIAQNYGYILPARELEQQLRDLPGNKAKAEAFYDIVAQAVA